MSEEGNIQQPNSSPPGNRRTQGQVVTPGAESVTTTTEREETPHLDEAIDEIRSYQYQSPLAQGTPADATEEEFAAFMMFNSLPAAPLPQLETEPWPHAGQDPNPVNIGTARRLLAAGFEDVKCDIEGAEGHGHAWMIETSETWLARKGTAVVQPPPRPARVTEYTIKAQWEYMERLRIHTLYEHLVQAGKKKLIEWFRKAVFNDLYRDGILPRAVTPREMLSHISEVYAGLRHNRRYMTQVKEEFETPYNPKEPVEAYFMKLQDARAHAKLLEEPYTDRQVMRQALTELEKHHRKDVFKAEKKWGELPTEKHTWENFKRFWKEEIHQWKILNQSTKHANQAVLDEVSSLTQRLNAMQANVSALQEENRSVVEQNETLVQQIQFQNALQATDRRTGSSSDEISAITDYMVAFEQRMNDRINAMSGEHGGDTQQLLKAAKNRDPSVYKNLNDGKGKQFSRYCWKCGCNTTHSTHKCYELQSGDKQRYKDATFNNRMGGSAKFLERRDKYQADYGFDSL